MGTTGNLTAGRSLPDNMHLACMLLVSICTAGHNTRRAKLFKRGSLGPKHTD